MSEKCQFKGCLAEAVGTVTVYLPDLDDRTQITEDQRRKDVRACDRHLKAARGVPPGPFSVTSVDDEGADT